MSPVETCEICGERIPRIGRSTDFQTCSACQETAYSAYEGELREFIHLLEYDRVRVLGSLLAEAIEKLDLDNGPVLIVPVPLHAWKCQQPGFNQSELIVRAVMRSSGQVSARKGLADARGGDSFADWINPRSVDDVLAPRLRFRNVGA
jgi:predicted amidophosphoribosyltransferase